jgi:hypothetical protein
MKFQLTLNMASREGRAVHQITVDYPVESLKEFADVLQTHDFVFFANEFYHEGGRAAGNAAELRANGGIIVNTAIIGKVKVYVQ